MSDTVNPITFPGLAAKLQALADVHPRLMIGLCGPPGVGKSTVSARLNTELGEEAVVVGMDGFHLANSTLGRLGVADVKGAPHTFDAQGFVSLLQRIRDGHAQYSPAPVYAPAYDREFGESIGGVVEINSHHRIVIVEGNYLLMDGAWEPVRHLLDLSVFLVLDSAVRRDRLIARHVAYGRSVEAATAWVDRSDEANARLVAATLCHADHILHVDG